MSQPFEHQVRTGRMGYQILSRGPWLHQVSRHSRRNKRDNWPHLGKRPIRSQRRGSDSWASKCLLRRHSMQGLRY